MNKITPFIWFDHSAEEAVKLYTSIFRDNEVLDVSHYGEGTAMPSGSVMSMRVRLNNLEFIAFNGGPELKLSPATSLFVDCENQQEVDEYWSRLSEGGQEMQCGWLTDRFGVTWQIVPTQLPRLLNGEDAEGAKRAMEAMLKMKKLEIEALEKAYAG